MGACIMQTNMRDVHFAAKALPNSLQRPREMSRSMTPHPLSYQEIEYDPEYTLYNGRLTPESLVNVTDEEMYWKVIKLKKF